ncbi:protein BOLA4, chloroplastic/mitochondrial-like [Nicotiana tabacum]|uniref:Protein BOLA4, chloroplastic/mitochondrial-like n=1 Tax=Nicotiana tabacum TaxID=4097 RepID=A0A1S4ABX8_TOBAC|nr:PREDICTED: protein BOLA4, chloroplastic/mitochondrial-like [Nicotiana tabacum]
MTKALFARPNVAALCIRRLSSSVQPRVPSLLKCVSISARSYRPMKLVPQIGSKIELFAGRRTFSTRATSDTGSIDSPLMESMQKKIKEQLNADTVVVKDAYGDGRHVSIDVVSSAFEGQSAVNRQRMVYKAIWEELQNTVHAVDQMTTKTPTEAGK